MVTVVMKETRKGSPDGISVVEYEKGREYELPPRLAQIFIGAAYAEPVLRMQVVAQKAAAPPEQKVAEPAILHSAPARLADPKGRPKPVTKKGRK